MRQCPFKHTTAAAHRNILRTYSDGSTAGNTRSIGERSCSTLQVYSVIRYFTLHKIDQPDKISNHFVGRIGINFMRSTDLLHYAFTHNNYAVAHCHGFTLIMGYINNGNTKCFLNRQDLKTHAFTQFSIQIG